MLEILDLALIPVQYLLMQKQKAPGPYLYKSDLVKKSYKLELVIFEYDIVPYFELEGV